MQVIARHLRGIFLVARAARVYCGRANTVKSFIIARKQTFSKLKISLCSSEPTSLARFVHCYRMKTLCPSPLSPTI